MDQNCLADDVLKFLMIDLFDNFTSDFIQQNLSMTLSEYNPKFFASFSTMKLATQI